jgi:hypothetical protein
MGRIHKDKSIKYINKRHKQENSDLKQMINYMSLKNNEIQKKVMELEKYNHGLMEILNIQKAANDFQQQKIEILETNLSLINEQDYENKSGEFKRSLALACSIKTKASENKINEVVYDINFFLLIYIFFNFINLFL